MKKQVNIGIIGYGVVGSGTMQLIQEQKKEIETRVGAKLNVKWVCRRRKKKLKLPRGVKQTSNWKNVVRDPQVDCIVELVGGTNPAKQIVTTALKEGKHVVTANKAILSKYWDTIIGLSHRNRKLVYFEAAVGGGIPVVQALNEGLAGNKVKKITGILNGTTNYILTQMMDSGSSFENALEEAQEAGFAEADPSFDVKGVDAAQKISILSSLAIGKWVPPAKVYCEGITNLQGLDAQLIKTRLKSTIKLLGISELTPKGWIFRVHPTLVSNRHPFANVRNEYNAVSLHGSAADDVILYGKGAGRLPTSSAVLSDIIFLCRHIAMDTAGQLPFVPHREKMKFKFGSMADVHCKYYLRIKTADRPGVLARITGILGRHHVSLASVHQDLPNSGKQSKAIPIVLLTHKVREADVQASVKEIDRLRTTKAKTVLLRME